MPAKEKGGMGKGSLRLTPFSSTPHLVSSLEAHGLIKQLRGGKARPTPARRVQNQGMSPAVLGSQVVTECFLLPLQLRTPGRISET